MNLVFFQNLFLCKHPDFTDLGFVIFAAWDRATKLEFYLHVNSGY